MALCKPFDVQFVNQSLVPWDAGWGIRSPGEGGIDHAVFRHSGGIVPAIKRQVLLFVSYPISKVRIRPVQGSLKLLAIRIKKKFVWIKAMAAFGSVRAIHPIPVQLAGTNLGKI